MPTSKPPKPDPNQELTDRRIAEFAVEESRLSNVAYRFQLVPRDRASGRTGTAPSSSPTTTRSWASPASA